MDNVLDKTGKTAPRIRAFESFHPGEAHRSPSLVLDEARIRDFAELTGDFNPIHLDAEFARRTIHRGVIAHGLLVAALSTGMAYGLGLLGENILALESSQERYLAPVRPGDEIYGTVRIREVDGTASRKYGRVKWDTCVFKMIPDRDDVLAMEALWSTLVFKADFIPGARK